MRFKLIFILAFFISFSLCSPLSAWGKKGHRLINSKAIDSLPDELSKLKDWKDYIVENSSAADMRRDNDPTEAPKHFIDIDFYPEFLQGTMIKDKNHLISKYGLDTVTQMGLLPWATLDTYNNLVKAFSERNRDKVLIFITDLGHYVADGYQPFHTMLNYDGQLTNQRGIHGRYESEMINKYFEQIVGLVDQQEVEYVAEPLNYIFDYLTASHSYSPVIFSADLFAYQQAESHGSDVYYRIMWFRTKHLTVHLFSSAVKSFASLIYSAWIDAGMPNISDLN